MKALSIRQPWADLIVFCLNDIENRTRRTHYRGPLLIHAAQTLDEVGEWRLCLKPAFSADIGWLNERRNHVRLYGFIIGSVDLVDCVTQHSSKWFEGPYGYVLANPVKFNKPIPYRGLPGFFDVPDEVIAAAITAHDDDEGLEEAVCDVCGSSMAWKDCYNCVDGFSGHDCGEDCCCYADPEDNVVCDICHGEGGWLLCLNHKNHKRAVPV